LVVKDPAQSAAFYVDTLGLAVKVQSESMVELATDGPEHSGAGGIGSSNNNNGSTSGSSNSSSSGPSIVLKQAGYHASVLATGYSPIMTFDVADLDAAVAAALARGGMLDGPIKRPAFGKFASVRSPDGHMLGLFEGGA
jgi:catechol 2,3-dioxygenase-like lactoylglutathione lyase family enzyme